MTEATATHEHHHRGMFAILVLVLLPLFLTTVFAALKIFAVIDWTWMVVLIPIWIAILGLLPITLLVKCILKFVVKTGSRIP